MWPGNYSQAFLDFQESSERRSQLNFLLYGPDRHPNFWQFRIVIMTLHISISFFDNFCFF